MTAITLSLGDRLALALFLAESDSISAMPRNGKQFQDEFEAGLSRNISVRLDQLRDDKTFEDWQAKISLQPELVAKLKAIAKSQRQIRMFLGSISESLANGSLRLVLTEQPEPGDLCLVPSMKLAVAIVFLRLAHPDHGESMKDWTKAGRVLFRQFEDDASGELLLDANAVIGEKHPNPTEFVHAQRLLILTKMLEDQALSGPDIGAMLGSGELQFAEY